MVRTHAEVHAHQGQLSETAKMVKDLQTEKMTDTNVFSGSLLPPAAL